MKARLLLAFLLVLAAPAARPAADPLRLELDAQVVWRNGWKDFGGFSGLWVSPDGGRFIAISDRGSWIEGPLERENGHLVRARRGASGHLHGISGARVEAGDVDAEGLAVDGRGRAYVSYESFHRVRRYDDLRGPAAMVPSHPDFERFEQNSGLESLALDSEGTLYAIPERSGAVRRPFPVYRLRADGHWDKPYAIPRRGTFLVSDADFGPDGNLYVLERDFAWLGGFRTRVRRFTPGPDGLGEEATLLETSFMELDNMEGISVWRDENGRIRVTMISDDNFFPLQKTMFAEYVLTGQGASPVTRRR